MSILYRSRNLRLNIIMRELNRRVKNKVYTLVRGEIVKRRPIAINNSVFENWSSNIKIPFNNKNKDYYIEYLKKNNQEEEIILNADKVCNHIFNLLGSGEKNLGKDIQWNKDFKTGFIWENDFYTKIKTIDLNNKSDVKVPWELSRFQYIPILGQAYWITKNEKYSDEFKYQIKDWIIKNPVEMSVNWTCSMDVAIRACNWIIGVAFFKNNNDGIWVDINKYLFMHGEFIFKNLEKGHVSNNHYIANLVGLIWLGLYFKDIEYKKSNHKKWLKFGLLELESEIQKQVYDDGFSFEASTSYHCLVTELLLYTSILCRYNKVNLSIECEKKLEKMCEAIMNITKPNGLIPLIGDADNGRFIIFTGYNSSDIRDFRYLLGVAGEYFNRNDFRCKASNHLAALWMCSELNDNKMNYYSPKSVSYPQGGMHVLQNNRIYFITRCGKNGTCGIGGHTHNDQLSFELSIDGEDFIVDSGSPSYTDDYVKRNTFRSTMMHNTVQVEDFEQNEIDNKKLFALSDQTKAEVILFDKLKFSGKHYGFEEKCGVIHKREVYIEDNEIIIEDILNTKNEINENDVSVFSSIIFDKDVELIKNGDEIIAKKNKAKIYISIDSDYIIEDTNISYEYGKLEHTKKVKIRLNKNKSRVKIKF